MFYARGRAVILSFMCLFFTFDIFIHFSFKEKIFSSFCYYFFFLWYTNFLSSWALAQLVGTMHKICKVRGSNPNHYKKKRYTNFYTTKKDIPTFCFSPSKICVRLLVPQKFFITLFDLYFLVNLCLTFIFFNEIFRKCVEYYDNLFQKIL